MVRAAGRKIKEDLSTELDLARRIAAGDRDAAEAFAREHFPAVLRFALRLTERREEAEDIAQETFLTARMRIGGYRGRSTLRTWIHKIALNEYRQWRRKQRTLPLSIQDQPSDDAAIRSFEAGYLLRKAMQNIPQKQLEAFVLFEVEQLSMNEVAHVLGIPVGRAKARVFHARKSLRIQLEGRPEATIDEHKLSASGR